MLPIFVQLTNSDTGVEQDLLIARIQMMEEFTDTEKFKSGTIITYYPEMGFIDAQGGLHLVPIRMAFKEKKVAIYKKIKKAVLQSQKMMMENSKEFGAETEDDNPYNLFA